jgi:hypothetical protein
VILITLYLAGAKNIDKIIMSSVFSVTEILVIENYKLDNTFLHVTFGSQSLLKLTSDQTSYDINR